MQANNILLSTIEPKQFHHGQLPFPTWDISDQAVHHQTAWWVPEIKMSCHISKSNILLSRNIPYHAEDSDYFNYCKWNEKPNECGMDCSLMSINTKIPNQRQVCTK